MCRLFNDAYAVYLYADKRAQGSVLMIFHRLALELWRKVKVRLTGKVHKKKVGKFKVIFINAQGPGGVKVEHSQLDMAYAL